MVLTSNPVYNTIIFYILLVIIIMLIKPEFMYCHKNQKFKSFGFDKDQTVFCLPIVCLTSVIILYLLFVTINVVGNYLDK